jgi:hypothetical protein
VPRAGTQSNEPRQCPNQFAFLQVDYFFTQKSPSLDLLTGSAFTAARDTSLCESMSGANLLSSQLHRRRAVWLVEQGKLKEVSAVGDLEGEEVPE